MIQMKRFALSGLVGAVALAVSLTLSAPAHAAVSSWQKGVTYQASSSSDLYGSGFQQAMRNASADGANYVALVVQLHQDNTGSTNVYPAGDTPTDGSLVSAINYIHGLGMKVMLKPHVDSYDGQWRANINPGDRNAWFASYGAQLMHYAAFAQQNHVEELCIGAELVDMTRPDRNSSNTANWQALIGRVRTAYNGLLTYSAQRADGSNTDEVSTIGFWSQLDTIGVSAYYPLNGSSVQTMEQSWAAADNQYLAPVAARYGKPLLFTEVGYRSADNAASEPYNYYGGGTNQGLQANLYQALLEYWNGSSHFSGVMLWDWNSSGDQSYNPQGKQAETVLRNWFAGSGTTTGGGGGTGGNGGGTATPPPVVNTNPGSVTTSSTSTNATQNQSTSVTVSATAQTTAANLIVDVEIYDPSGNRAVQQYFENQTLTAGQAWTKQITFTPSQTGTYTVKVGVFAAGWGTNYNWNNAAGTVAVASATPVVPPVTTPPVTTPPTPPVTTPPTTTPPTNTGGSNLAAATLSIWWPSNGSSVSGVQPFKARLDNIDNAAYTMYWQVDGGSLNAMGNATDHKEQAVDLSGWNWQPSGTYTITFVAKDLNGNVVKTQSVQIHITH